MSVDQKGKIRMSESVSENKLSKNEGNLESRLLQRKQESGTALSPREKLDLKFNQYQSTLSELMGGPTEAKRLYVAFLNQASRSPTLLQCTPESVFACMVVCAELKCFPGPMQEVALIPRRSKKTDQLECTVMLQYQGLLKLAYNAGFIKKITCRVVWSNEAFDYKCGSDEHIDHTPFEGPEEERGARVGVYCIIKTKYGEEQIAYLTSQQIERIKKRAQGSDKADSPWSGNHQDDLDWMWKKSALKQALKLLPKSAELAKALEQDDGTPEKPKIIDLTPELTGSEGITNEKEN